jgi:hypothetical protein
MPHGEENAASTTEGVYVQAHIIIIIVIAVIVTIICCAWYFFCRVTDPEMIIADRDIREK